MCPDFHLAWRLGLVAVGLALASPLGGCDEDGAGRGASSPSPARQAGHRPAPPPALPGATPVIRHAAQDQTENFALLRQEPEPLPLSIRRILRQPEFGANWALARRLPLKLGRTFWLVPGRDVLCLVYPQSAHNVATACAPTDVALKHGVVAVSLRDAGPVAPAQRLIVGVVPDGVRRVVVRTGSIASSAAIARHTFVIRDTVNRPPDVVFLKR